MGQFFHENFPLFAKLLPSTAEPVQFAVPGGGGEGWCTHPDLFQRRVLDLLSGAFLKLPDIPDGFVAMGIYARPAGEQVFVMWRFGDRRFWFRHRYMSSHMPIRKEETARLIWSALYRWNEGRDRLVGFDEGHWCGDETKPPVYH